MTQTYDTGVMFIPIEKIKFDESLAALPALAPDDCDRLARSIADHGIRVPLLVRGDGANWTLIDGRHRLNIARRLGKTVAPCVIVETKNPLETALDVAINRRRLTKTGIAFFIIQAFPELLGRVGRHDSSTSFNKGRTGVEKINTHADKGTSVRGMSEKYGIDISYLSKVLTVLEACRPKSHDALLVHRLIIDEEVSATNLMKALQGWQASHPVGDDADPAAAPVAKKAPVNVVEGMARSLTFIRCQAIAFDKLDQKGQSIVMEQFARTWAVLPPALQGYALKQGKTKDYEAARKKEAELSKPIPLSEASRRITERASTANRGA